MKKIYFDTLDDKKQPTVIGYEPFAMPVAWVVLDEYVLSRVDADEAIHHVLQEVGYIEADCEIPQSLDTLEFVGDTNGIS